MEIYIVRHGIAEDPEHAKEDSERRLTEEGIKKTGKMAKEFRKRVDKIDVIFHSPYERAVHTAKIFAEEFPKAKLTQAKGLTPHDSPRSALPLLEGAGHDGCIMIVGHEPHLSSLVSLILTGNETPIVEMKKAGIAGIEMLGSFRHCRLSFLLSPKWL